eukprot:3007106-Lingulodinium_polyedra.AAC.2
MWARSKPAIHRLGQLASSATSRTCNSEHCFWRKASGLVEAQALRSWTKAATSTPVASRLVAASLAEKTEARTWCLVSALASSGSMVTHSTCPRIRETWLMTATDCNTWSDRTLCLAWRRSWSRRSLKPFSSCKVCVRPLKISRT